MSPDSQPHYSEGHPHHVVFSSNVAQFEQQVQFQSPNQPPQIFSFIDHHKYLAL